MDITLEAVEKVIDATGVDFKTAKKALEETDGNPEDAIKYLTPEKNIDKAQDIVEKIKEKVEEGNVTIWLQSKENFPTCLSNFLLFQTSYRKK